MERVQIDQALERITSGSRVYVHGGAATPHALLTALAARAPSLSDVQVVAMHTEGDSPHTAPGMEPHFRHNALFIGKNVRDAVQQGRADYTPVFLSEIPSLFAPGGPLPLDTALIHVTPPDRNGMCSLGVSVDCALPAARHAKLVIAQVNPRMPRTRGHQLPASEIDLAVEVDDAIPEIVAPPPDECALAIGRHVAALIDDGATLQMGIGAIPNGVLAALAAHRDLGIHTEMFTDGLLPLVESG
ncbi:MAG: acetyl-CoA hydrolase/transferase family protein, partial [Tepidiformaceae bacterium]